MSQVVIIGGGFAGSEAALQLAQRGVSVVLYEMRPQKPTAAHKTEKLAELVCSNSFGSLGGASGILKEEMKLLGSELLKVAFEEAVPAGQSLSVDRDRFAQAVTSQIEEHPLITIKREECSSLKNVPTLIATGPLTSEALSRELSAVIGQEHLAFYDAISPIVNRDSLDLSNMYFASRYDKGDADFLNVPLNKNQYETLMDDLLNAEVAEAKSFEDVKYFESCMPIEVLVSRGRETLRFGPMKPVGLQSPDGEKAHAVIQLRTENRHKTAFNLVGFQTKMKYGEQVRVFRKLPGFENAEFLRLGSLHRNTYLNSPEILTETLQLKKASHLFVAGQLTGTEGYLEAMATGMIAGIQMDKFMRDQPALQLPEVTMLGSLLKEITSEKRTKNFQPMNANLGVLPPLDHKERNKKLKAEKMRDRALKELDPVLSLL